MKKDELKKISGKDLYFKGMDLIKKEKLTIKQFIKLCDAWLQLNKGRKK